MYGSPLAYLFEPGQSATTGYQTASDIAGANNPYLLNKQQPLNRGLSRNLFPAYSQQGKVQAMQHAAPIQQSIADTQGNAQMQIGRNRLGQQMMLQAFPMVNHLFGQATGLDPLGRAFGGF